MGRKFHIRISVLVCVLLGLAITGVRLSGETTGPQLRRVGIGGRAHDETQVQPESSFQLATTSAPLADSEPISPPRPTRSSFMATWKPVSGAKGYLLDVSTSNAFDRYVNGYHDLDVGNATGRVVTGLNRGTTYFYRVRPYGLRTTAGYTETMAVPTDPTTGLTIHATFDSSITGNANAAAIEATINQAISIYEALFTDPITIQIRFRYATNSPIGNSLDTFVEGLTVVYDIAGNTWINALRTDAKSSNDRVAMASVGNNGFTSLVETSANGRALGQNSPPAMNADGTISVGAPYDGIVTLNSATPFQFTRPTDANRFDAQRSIEKGIGSIMGLVYSLTDFTPVDLFSWSAPGQRNSNYTATPRYFSIDGGVINIVNFNNTLNGTYADWQSGACPQAHPYVQNAVPCRGQSSDVSATSPEGIALDVIGYDVVQAQTGPPRLGNISTRSFVQTGDNVMIGGFIVQGTGPKRVMIRAIGPELTQFGVPNALANPILELHDGNGALIATNNDWQTTIIGGIITASQVTDIQNRGHAPTAASESAIIANLQPGNYTAIVRGVNNTTGVALVEVYDLH